MKKLLYITDQDEYVDHCFIAPLFEHYLQKYLTVDIIYFTEYKSDCEQKRKHRFTVPTRYKNVLLDELARNGLSIEEYVCVMVRNDIEIMKYILKEKDKYQYQTAFRLSYPKRIVKIQTDKANKQSRFFALITDKLKTKMETKIINRCDMFLPSSQSMHEFFFPKVIIKTIIFPPGIDPNMLYPNIQHEEDETKFFYAGRLDRAREFETVLKAFSLLKSNNWKLSISTEDIDYALSMVKEYKNLEKHISIHNTKRKCDLLELIVKKADVGVALLPNIPIYNTSTPVKIFDYYSYAIPSLITDSKHIKNVFTDSKSAWLCKFEHNDIKEKLEYIISLSKKEIADVGTTGQKRLFDIRNYEKIAKDLATVLKAL